MLVQNDEVELQAFLTQIGMGGEQLTDQGKLLDLGDSDQDDGKIPRNTETPQRRLALPVCLDDLRGGARAGAGVENVSRHSLIQVSLLGRQVQVAEFNLTMSPGEIEDTPDALKVVVMIRQCHCL